MKKSDIVMTPDWVAKMMLEVVEYGGVKEMLVVAPGSRLKFSIGFCIAAVHFERGYEGPMKIGFST